MRQRLRSLVLAAPLLFAAAAACAGHSTATPELAHPGVAEAIDSFGLGEGRSGALAVTAPATVVNTYAPITAVDATATHVTFGALQGAAGPFAPGDLLLVWRTTGLGATSANQATFNLATDVGGFEFGRVKSVTGSVVTLTNPLGSATRYTTGAQLVRVPEYTTATVQAGASVVPYPWDGSSGGVVIFLATGAITTDGAVVADGAGFRGGGLENATMQTGAPDCSEHDGSDEANPCGGAHKGEGLDPAAYALPTTPSGQAVAAAYGFGNYADGAGGGEARNAGGGGGGGIGEGGGGGNTSSTDGDRAVGGLGGAPVSYDPTMGFVALGGGGGAGDEDQGTGTAGGAGGGVVYLRAASFAGAGTYSASGASVTATAGKDGSGGGGAGGAILLFSASTVSCTSATANGGAGGSGGSEPDGPGGGGGGGLVQFESTMTTCTLSANGGAAGTTDATADLGQPYGATVGATGHVDPGSGAEYGGGPCTPAIVGTNVCGGCVLSTDCPAGEVCDGATNQCGKCNGDDGSGATAACPTAAAPHCLLTGAMAGACAACATSADCTTPSAPACATATFTCVSCTGDEGTTATAPCPTSEPFCEPSGACGMCSSDTECMTDGGHAGAHCDTTTGACGEQCAADATCGAGQWCDNLTSDGGSGLCQAQAANGQPVPGGACTENVGARACASGVCGTSDDLCGLADGALCASGDAGEAQCRSGVCVASGANQGKCAACATDSSCASTPATPACSPANTCVACSATNGSTCGGDTPVCDTTGGTCAPCGGDLGTPRDLTCVSASAPYCFSAGNCGSCTVSTQCEGPTHAGPVCDTTSGACTTACSTSSQCGVGEWCRPSDGGAGTCAGQLPDGTALPPGTSCTTATATAICVSGTCNPKTNDCGLGSGDAGPPDGGSTDASLDVGLAGAGVSIEGGALSCDLRGQREPRGGPPPFTWLFGLLVGAAALRRRTP